MPDRPSVRVVCQAIGAATRARPARGGGAASEQRPPHPPCAAQPRAACGTMGGRRLQARETGGVGGLGREVHLRVGLAQVFSDARVFRRQGWF